MTLESTPGPYSINDFNRFGRTWQVNVQPLNLDFTTPPRRPDRKLPPLFEP
jgi:hypothetical protein